MFDEKFSLALAFFTFLALIIKFVAPRIGKALDDKSQKIAEEILAAKELRQKAEILLSKAEKYHQESVDFANKVISDAEAEAQKFAKESAALLESELSKRTAAALERIRLEEEEAVRQIKTKIISQALQQTEDELSLDAKSHAQLVEKSLKEVVV